MPAGDRRGSPASAPSPFQPMTEKFHHPTGDGEGPFFELVEAWTFRRAWSTPYAVLLALAVAALLALQIESFESYRWVLAGGAVALPFLVWAQWTRRLWLFFIGLGAAVIVTQIGAPDSAPATRESVVLAFATLATALVLLWCAAPFYRERLEAVRGRRFDLLYRLEEQLLSGAEIDVELAYELDDELDNPEHSAELRRALEHLASGTRPPDAARALLMEAVEAIRGRQL